MSTGVKMSIIYGENIIFESNADRMWCQKLKKWKL